MPTIEDLSHALLVLEVSQLNTVSEGSDSEFCLIVHLDLIG